jgi:hypothetical protein
MSSEELRRWIHNTLISIWGPGHSYRRTVQNISIPEPTNSIPNGWAASSLHNGDGTHVIKMKPGQSLSEYLAIAMHESAHAVLHDMVNTGDLRKLNRDAEELTVQMITFMGLNQYRPPSNESGIFVSAIEFAKRVLIYEYIPRFGSIHAAISTFANIRLAFKTLPPYLDDALTIISRYPTHYDPHQAMSSVQTHWRSSH